MSEKYTEKDNETTLSIFNKRVIYDFDSRNSNYSNLTDFNFGEKLLYGRVSRNFIPIYFNNSYIKLKTFDSTLTRGTPLQAINFVVDMFERLRTQFEKCLTIGKISADDPFLSSLKVYKGFQDPISLHGSYLQTYLGSIGRQLNKSKYQNLDQFMVLFEGLIAESLKLYPITFGGFVKSRFCPISVSGLAIEIADAEYFNDNRKIEEFVNSPNWEFYLNACRSYGFMIDKLVPWRLVADIGTKECIEFSNVYNLNTTNEILVGGYARTDLIFFNKLKFYLLNLYNQNSKPYAESYDCNGIPKTRYIEPQKLTIESFNKKVNEQKLLDLYFKMRILEEDKVLTEGQKLKLRSDCLQIYQLQGLPKSLRRFERIINQPFDSPGSLSYINERITKQREDR